MEHVAEDELALAALGEPLPDDARGHLDGCPECRAALASYETVVVVGRAVTAEDAPQPPADHVWERIREEIASEVDARPTPVVSLDSRRRPRARWYLAAAVWLLVGGAVGAVVTDRLRGDDPAPTVLAEVALAGLPDWQNSSGVARVEVDASGARTLVVNLAGQTFDDGFQEVWLIDRDVTRLVSLGVVEGTKGRLPIPASVDLDVYAVVDVSAEPVDGDPKHSGDSIVRGVIGA